MKATTKLIVHSTLGHLTGRVFHHLERIFRSCPIVCVQKKLKCHRRVKFWGAAKSAVDFIVVLGNPAISALQNFRSEQIARLFG